MKKILITGTSSGLGMGLTNYYLNNDFSVYGIGRKSHPKHQANIKYNHLHLDLSDFDALNKYLPEYIKQIEYLDLVILNAGFMNEIKDMSDTSLAEIEAVMKVNVWANKLIIDILNASHVNLKQIVAISSGAAISGARGWNAYALSKVTLNMLINLYSKENPEIHFCALAPGLVQSKMQDYLVTVEEVDKFPVLKRLNKSRGTAAMPGENEAGKIVATAIDKVTDYPSGTFLDVRKM